MTETEFPYQEILDIIKQHTRSTQFFTWLGGDDVDVRVLSEKVQEDKYERVMEYYIDEIHVFSIGGLAELPSIFEHPRAPDASIQLPPPNKYYFFDFSRFPNMIPFIAKMEKKVLSQTLGGDKYTVLSHLLHEQKLSGSIWEIYDLHNLTEVYKQRKQRLQSSTEVS